LMHPSLFRSIPIVTRLMVYRRWWNIVFHSKL
jgi:hypothetical protein